MSYKLGKVCERCEIAINDRNKSGFCKEHIDRTGPNNPFYGKTHSKETIDAARPKIAEASKRLWKDPEYREKIIKGVSKPRREGFKAEQSKRIKKWYALNPEQRTIRSEKMKQT